MCLLFLLGLNSHSLLLFKFRHGLERQEPRHQDEPKGACPTVATQESPNLKESEQVLYAKRRPYFEPTEASDMVVCFPAVLHCNSRQISRQASEEGEMNSKRSKACSAMSFRSRVAHSITRICTPGYEIHPEVLLTLANSGLKRKQCFDPHTYVYVAV